MEFVPANAFLGCDKCTDSDYCAANSICLLTPTPLVDSLIKNKDILKASLHTSVVSAPDTSVYDSIAQSVAKQPASATLADVLDLLMAGKKLQLSFQTVKDADSFRTSLYRYKRRVEGQMESVGIDFDKHSLEWHVSGGGHLAALASMQLIPKKQTLYTIINVEDGNSTEETQVSSGVGKT